MARQRPTRLRFKGPAIRNIAMLRCSSLKMGHASYDQAHRVAENMMTLDKVMPGCHLMPYLCTECGEWHVANKRIVFRESPAPEVDA
jgi:hypothetical protein